MSEHDADLDGLIDAYVSGRLNAGDQARLEQAMLDDPALLERVEQTELIRRGLRDSLLTAPDRPAWRWPSGWLAGVLSLAVVGLLGWNLVLNRQNHELLGPQAGIPVITLHDQRTLIESEPPASKAGGNRPTLIELDVSAIDSETFDLRIESPQQDIEFNDLRRDHRGYLTVLIGPMEPPLTFRISSPDSERILTFEISQWIAGD